MSLPELHGSSSCGLQNTLAAGQEEETVKHSRRKHEKFIPQQSLKFQNISALSQKVIELQNVFRKYWGAKHLPAWFCAGAVKWRPACLRREVSAQMWIRLGRNLNLHFFLLKPTLLLAQNPSQKRSIRNHKRFWKIFQFLHILAEKRAPLVCKPQQTKLPNLFPVH